jgi:Arc/MetJ-type ribon-helix-helix transcriptional regulator
MKVPIDTHVLEAVQAAVAAGEAESVSAYVNDALRLKAEHDRELRGIDDFIAAYEAEHGVILDAGALRTTRPALAARHRRRPRHRRRHPAQAPYYQF